MNRQQSLYISMPQRIPATSSATVEIAFSKNMMKPTWRFSMPSTLYMPYSRVRCFIRKLFVKNTRITERIATTAIPMDMMDGIAYPPLIFLRRSSLASVSMT